MKQVGRILLLLCAALALAGCGRSASYRYKLTISLNTPDGVKTASVVNEVTLREIYIEGTGIADNLDGEALYLDLGPGRRPLLALVIGVCDNGFCSTDFKTWGELLKHWFGPIPTNMMARLYGDRISGSGRTNGLFKEFATLAKVRPPPVLQPSDLPMLVTFDDINDPKSVRLVKSNDLAASLGPGVSWRSITLQPTHEPLTTGIEQKLPWLKTMKVKGGWLGGKFGGWGPTMPKYSLANSLSFLHFETLGR